MTDFEKACLKSDVSIDRAKNVTLNGVEVAIFQTSSGYVARSGVCKHNAFKFELCEVNGDVVRCPLHGWTYKISTGKGIKPSWTCLEQYPLEERGEELWVDVNDPAKDEDLDTSAYQW